jgi:Flp pilus assembly protein TadG
VRRHGFKLILLSRFYPFRILSTAESGSALVEFSIALLPLVALLLFTVDVAWAIFARATLQHAVREGVRFAVTGQTLPGSACLGASVQQVVARNSFGFVPAARASSEVTVSYYSATDLSSVTGAGAPAGGNVVQVTISGVSIRSFGPIWRNVSPIPLSASASDVMESPPNGVLPCP